ncbi:MAG TPA: hypothetical protein VGC99_14220 [Candidatus Tectomicrobia bacterium]
MPQIKCLLWDFGDTLCDKRFIWSSGQEWMEIYETFDDDGLGSRWCLGELDTKTFAEALSERMSKSPESIIAHMTECCGAIRFFDKTYDFFRAKHLPQAIVTVNPDLFSDVIVPICDLHEHCDVIVTSWEERTDDKRVLNGLAIKRLGLYCENAEALLIDNKRSNIDDWIGIQGSGYHYTGDDAFAADTPKGIDALAQICGA